MLCEAPDPLPPSPPSDPWELWPKAAIAGFLSPSSMAMREPLRLFSASLPWTRLPADIGRPGLAHRGPGTPSLLPQLPALLPLLFAPPI